MNVILDLFYILIIRNIKLLLNVIRIQKLKQIFEFVKNRIHNISNRSLNKIKLSINFYISVLSIICKHHV